MSSAPPPRGPANVPTLTEVVDVPLPLKAPAEGEDGDDWSRTVRLPGGASPYDEAELTHAVLADVQRQIDLMVEYRLREAIAPVLARASDMLIRELRQELAEAMRDIVARAVAREISRHRGR